MNGQKDVPDPAVILDLLEAFRRSKVMFAAVSLGLFDAIEAGAHKVEELSPRLKADASALARLLDACVGLHLLDHTGDKYENTPAASAYLTSDSPRRMTGYIGYSNDVMWKLWAHLEDAVREGGHRWKQAYGWEGPIFSHFFRTEEAKREFLMGMHGFGIISSPQVVAAFDLTGYRHLCDLGGATGHLAIAACERYPNLRGTVFDLPDAAPLAREIVSASPVASRVDIASGDFFTDALPEADLYALGRILHDWSEDKILKLLSAHLRSLALGRGIADRREVTGRRQTRSALGADARSQHAHLHRRSGADADRVHGPAPASRLYRGGRARHAVAARRRAGEESLENRASRSPQRKKLERHPPVCSDN